MLTIVATESRKRGGRQRGTPNAINADVREMVLEALERVGGASYLAYQAKKNPTTFMSLLGRLLPTKVTNEDGSPIQLHLLAAMSVEPLVMERQAEPQQPLVIEGSIPTE